jgi:hypothetical protein
MSEAAEFLAAAPKMPNGKVDVLHLIEEGQKRGYCICPKPMRQMVSFDGLVCTWCGMVETRQSWAFWYDDNWSRPETVSESNETG